VYKVYAYSEVGKTGLNNGAQFYAKDRTIQLQCVEILMKKGCKLTAVDAHMFGNVEHVVWAFWFVPFLNILLHLSIYFYVG